ncbi:unnamed protein product [Ambrosiozyma monospora]|uniref:Unnamed protein product n=1 Tax=Ambrosiozyma monospora TaxID=43982 RepID=A0A9W6YS66_AMBMO|nr:unnamed protein product [Ambrosiozyma monospora]
MADEFAQLFLPDFNFLSPTQQDQAYPSSLQSTVSSNHGRRLSASSSQTSSSERSDWNQSGLPNQNQTQNSLQQQLMQQQSATIQQQPLFTQDESDQQFWTNFDDNYLYDQQLSGFRLPSHYSSMVPLEAQERQQLQQFEMNNSLAGGFGGIGQQQQQQQQQFAGMSDGQGGLGPTDQDSPLNPQQQFQQQLTIGAQQSFSGLNQQLQQSQPQLQVQSQQQQQQQLQPQQQQNQQQQQQNQQQQFPSRQSAPAGGAGGASFTPPSLSSPYTANSYPFSSANSSARQPPVDEMSDTSKAATPSTIYANNSMNNNNNNNLSQQSKLEVMVMDNDQQQQLAQQHQNNGGNLDFNRISSSTNLYGRYRRQSSVALAAAMYYGSNDRNSSMMPYGRGNPWTNNGYQFQQPQQLQQLQQQQVQPHQQQQRPPSIGGGSYIPEMTAPTVSLGNGGQVQFGSTRGPMIGVVNSNYNLANANANANAHAYVNSSSNSNSNPGSSGSGGGNSNSDTPTSTGHASNSPASNGVTPKFKQPFQPFFQQQQQQQQPHPSIQYQQGPHQLQQQPQQVPVNNGMPVTAPRTGSNTSFYKELLSLRRVDPVTFKPLEGPRMAENGYSGTLFDSAGQDVKVGLDCVMEGKFYINQKYLNPNQEGEFPIACYRRNFNLLSISLGFSAPARYYVDTDSGNDTKLEISNIRMSVESTSNFSKELVEILIFDSSSNNTTTPVSSTKNKNSPGRDDPINSGAAGSPSLLYMNTNQVSLVPFQGVKTIVLKRFQFKKATPNNGKSVAKDYYYINLNLDLDFTNGETKRIKTVRSIAISVRGRNPSFYNDRNEVLISKDFSKLRMDQRATQRHYNNFNNHTNQPKPNNNNVPDQPYRLPTKRSIYGMSPDAPTGPISTSPATTAANPTTSNSFSLSNSNKRKRTSSLELESRYTYFPIKSNYYLPPVHVYWFPHNAAHKERSNDYKRFTKKNSKRVGLGPTYKYFLKKMGLIQCASGDGVGAGPTVGPGVGPVGA